MAKHKCRFESKTMEALLKSLRNHPNVKTISISQEDLGSLKEFVELLEENKSLQKFALTVSNIYWQLICNVFSKQEIGVLPCSYELIWRCIKSE